jgi:hypothetical protein
MSESNPTAPAICLVVDHPGETADQFETVMAHLGRTGPVPPLGASLLVSGPTQTGWRSVSVWDSHESIARFVGERLVPAYREAGLSPEHAQQSTFDVHTILATPATA